MALLCLWASRLAGGQEACKSRHSRIASLIEAQFGCAFFGFTQGVN